MARVGEVDSSGASRRTRRAGAGWRSLATWQSLAAWRSLATWQSLAAWRSLVVDVALAGAVAAIGLAGSAPAGQGQVPAPAPMDTTGYALVLLSALSLVVRRLSPLVTLGVTAAATSTYLLLDYPYGPALLSPMVAVYTVAARLPPRRAALACVPVLGALLVHLFFDHGSGLFTAAPVMAFVVVPFAVGATVRVGGEAQQRTRADQLRRSADDERLRVAQEVHDVVGHGLAAIHMQAEIALHLLAKRPEQAQVALTAISRTSKEALDELRATLTVVRRGEPGQDRAPTPGLANLGTLVARLAGTGLPVRVEIGGTARQLPVAVDLAAYRVVQESLTNVLRHTGGAATVVRVDYLPGEVRIVL